MNESQHSPSPQVQWVTITDDHAGQRIDNFLITFLKGVPKSLIYRLLRKGEVRVNKKRIKPEYKLADGDQLRIAPIRVAEPKPDALPSANLDKVKSLEKHIVYEDKVMLVLNKPSGIAVHGGSGLNFGVIEALRALRPEERNLELVHRIDRATSGLLMIAKKRSALKHLQDQLRQKTMRKQYLCLVKGRWPAKRRAIQAPLLKRELNTGERAVSVSPEGKPSETRFRIIESFSGATLMEASPVTGRTHQIRVHTQYAGHPIACDERYGDDYFDGQMQKQGLDRLFLHAFRLTFTHPVEETTMQLEAPLEPKLQTLLGKLRNNRD
ncbi:23S rRNA pseudouridine(955/2504/2580) synthase RluC [Ferrimonas senticii]|uniref:23S rRNA pseudouridine(955/2504/2580) synthase RluC n=1 Tax=Ferrimonas senticii TaxID=394566 RepID=UPI0004880DBF|nr:23S rRNA pseudouridine(955/2504/2580) synthase RluC [Ferrimonas senticii]